MNIAKFSRKPVMLLLVMSLMMVPIVPQQVSGTTFVDIYTAVEWTYYKAYADNDFGDGDGVTAENYMWTKVYLSYGPGTSYSTSDTDTTEDISINPPFWSTSVSGTPNSESNNCAPAIESYCTLLHVTINDAHNYNIHFDVQVRFYDEDVYSDDAVTSLHIEYWTSLTEGQNWDGTAYIYDNDDTYRGYFKFSATMTTVSYTTY